MSEPQSSTDHSLSCKTFPQFSKLPKELQIQVIRMFPSDCALTAIMSSPTLMSLGEDYFRTIVLDSAYVKELDSLFHITKHPKPLQSKSLRWRKDLEAQCESKAVSWLELGRMQRKCRYPIDMTRLPVLSRKYITNLTKRTRTLSIPDGIVNSPEPLYALIETLNGYLPETEQSHCLSFISTVHLGENFISKSNGSWMGFLYEDCKPITVKVDLPDFKFTPEGEPIVDENLPWYARPEQLSEAENAKEITTDLYEVHGYSNWEIRIPNISWHRVFALSGGSEEHSTQNGLASGSRTFMYQASKGEFIDIETLIVVLQNQMRKETSVQSWTFIDPGRACAPADASMEELSGLNCQIQQALLELDKYGIPIPDDQLPLDHLPTATKAKIAVKSQVDSLFHFQNPHAMEDPAERSF